MEAITNTIRTLNIKFIIFFILPLAYLIGRIVIDFFTVDASVSTGRASFLIVLILVGLSLCNTYKFSSLCKAAFAFSIYTTAICFFDNPDNLFSYISIAFVWSSVLFITINNKLTGKDIQVIALILGFVCNVMAYEWYRGMNNSLTLLNGVGAFNSIYYVLVAYLYISIIKNRIIALIMMPYPFFCFINSNKTTCVIVATFIVLYYIYSSAKNLSYAMKILFIISLIAISVYILGSFDLSEVVGGAQSDFENGGNGRTAIYTKVISLISFSNFTDLIWGHGINAVSKAIGIGAHNDFLEVLFNYGLIGFSLYLWIWIELIRGIKTIYSTSLRSTYFLSIIVFFCVSMVSKFIGSQMQMVLFSVLWGMCLNSNSYKTKCLCE